jgi:hypothetical protein
MPAMAVWSLEVVMAAPKSEILTSLPLAPLRRMLAGLRSRWMTPRR